MANNSYKRGADFERGVAKRFRDTGCFAVRSAGSKTSVDVIVIDPKSKEVRLIQCKTGVKTSMEDLIKTKELKKFEGDYKVVIELWHKQHGTKRL